MHYYNVMNLPLSIKALEKGERRKEKDLCILISLIDTGHLINFLLQGTTILQQPDKIIHLGNTQIPYDMFLDYIHELASTSFR